MTLEYIESINEKVPYEWQKRYARRPSFFDGLVIYIAPKGFDSEYRINNIRVDDEEIQVEDLNADDFYICDKYGKDNI